MSEPWQFTDVREMLFGLIGSDFGPEPEKRIPEIRDYKKDIARYIIKRLKLKPSDEVLELGSGCGFLSYWVAPRVKHLKCCDISAAFLEFAAAECASRSNISFHRIESMDLGFLDAKSVDAVYAHAVFIHLNLYEIFWYFREFARVMRSKGRLWLDIANSESLRLPAEQTFLEMANIYKDAPSCLPSLMQWNSAKAVKEIAKYCGFRVDSAIRGRDFLFSKS